MKHQSYKMYVEDIVNLVPEEIDMEFKKYLTESLMPIAENAWTDYFIGDRENYMLYDDELELAWQKAAIEQTQDCINRLIDLDLIRSGVNENGDIVYSVSEEGIEYLKNNDSF